MGLLSWTVGLPLAPVRGLIGVGRLIQRQVDAETRDPAAVRRRLEAIDEAKRQGRIDPEEAARLEAETTRAMVRPRPPGAVAREPEESER
jgi:hypothetical protein